MTQWADGKIRCFWANPNNPRYIRYHDEEWGRPVHEDRKLFEMLLLETFQAGLSWECVLNKREGFRQAFDGFDPEIIAGYTEAKTEALRQNPAIIRNRLKIRAAVTNAQVFLAKRNGGTSTGTCGTGRKERPSGKRVLPIPLCPMPCPKT